MIREIALQLLALLAGWDRRLRLQKSLLWLPRGLLLGVGAGIILALVARLRPVLLPDQIAALTAIAAGVGALGVLAAIWLRQQDSLRLARFFDDTFDLKERLSTSLEIAAGRIRSPNPEITAHLLEDTLTRAQRIDPAAYLPLRVRSRDVGLLLGLIAFLALLLALPNPQSQALAEQQLMQATIQQQVEQLEALREQVAENATIDQETREALLEAIDRATERLAQEELSREEAFATLSDLAEEMRAMAERSRTLSPEQREAYRQAADALRDRAADLSHALEQADPARTAEALQQLSRELTGIGQAEQQPLAEALQAAAEALREVSPELAENLREAAEALQREDTAAAQQALEEAAAQAAQEAAQQAGQQATESQTAARQIASQAAQQAEQGAQQVARQPGQQRQGQPGGDSGDQTGDGAAATRIQQIQPGQDGQSTESGEQGQASQPGGQAGDEAGEQSQQGIIQGIEPDDSAGDSPGAAPGAGDSAGGQQEGSFAASGETIDQNNAPDGSGLTEYEPIFAPRAIGAGGGQQVQLSGSGEPGDTVVDEGDFVQEPEGQSIIGYDRVFSDYANAARQALQRDYIPLSMRDIVRNYFASLEP
ncbi:MAG: hypothetical protein HPY64_06320 [Anaerolineae bacterium]|nr:hypothetical protein [Anaerolineae bacterium]